MTAPALTRTNLADRAITTRQAAIVTYLAENGIRVEEIRVSLGKRLPYRLEVYLRANDGMPLLLAKLERLACDIGVPWDGHPNSMPHPTVLHGSWRRQTVEGTVADGGIRLMLVDLASRA